MKYTSIGEWRVSNMMLGTVQLGMDYGVANSGGKPSMEQAFDVLDAAHEGGVSALDTAAAYGESEAVLGRYAAERKPEPPLFIVTKVGVRQDDDVSERGVERQIRGSVERSLQRLGVSRLPLCLLHRPDDMRQYGDAVPHTLRALKEEGLIERAGASVYYDHEIETMLEDDIYEAVQLPVNLFDLRLVRGDWPLRLHQAGRMVFVRSVFLQGLFFLDPDRLPDELTDAAAALRMLRRLARDEGVGVAQAAVSFVRDLPGVTSLVLGAETAAQVRENVRLMEGPPLSDAMRTALEPLAASVQIESVMQTLARFVRENRRFEPAKETL